MCCFGLIGLDSSKANMSPLSAMRSFAHVGNPFFISGPVAHLKKDWGARCRSCPRYVSLLTSLTAFLTLKGPTLSY